MSKEQTLITAEEFLDQDEFVNVKGFVSESGTLRTTTSLMEQFAQYREKKAVQEALEREVPKAHTEGQAFLIKRDNLKHGRYPIASEGYYETQVKPKYE
jgi:hypothetical protein